MIDKLQKLHPLQGEMSPDLIIPETLRALKHDRETAILSSHIRSHARDVAPIMCVGFINGEQPGWNISGGNRRVAA